MLKLGKPLQRFITTRQPLGKSLQDDFTSGKPKQVTEESNLAAVEFGAQPAYPERDLCIGGGGWSLTNISGATCHSR